MKFTGFIGIGLILIITVSCDNGDKTDSLNNEQETGSKNLDPVSLLFFEDYIFSGNMTGKNAIYFLYPGFCGACNDTVIEFIKTNSLPNFKKQYIFSEEDTDLITQFNSLEGGIQIFEPELLMQFGLYKATNHLYLFRDNLLLYESAINTDNIEQVREETLGF